MEEPISSIFKIQETQKRGNTSPMLWKNLSIPSSRFKKPKREVILHQCYGRTDQFHLQDSRNPKRENIAWLKLIDTIFFLGTLSIV